MSGRPLPEVHPMPPGAGGRATRARDAWGLLRDPTAHLRRQRDRWGETFVVDAAGHRLLCVFSPAGVRSLYGFAEHEASFGLATYELIRRKVPDELFAGRRNTPHDLFGRQETERYLGGLEDAMTIEIDELGREGQFEIFAEARRLGHRLGLGSWAGAEAASARYLGRLIPLFDRLDGSEAFVRPGRTLVTTATGKRLERRAMHGIERVVAEIWAGRRGRAAEGDDFLAQLYRSFDDLPAAERDVEVARDLILIHMGSQSNLYAALAWTLVNLLLHPELSARVRDGEEGLLERCAYESIRMAQRSITLRQVLRPVDLDDGIRTYRVSPGVMIATMLSVTNTTAAHGLDHFDPDHYQGRRLAPSVVLPTKEVVSTFGHGIHTCPAQRFSISSIAVAVRRLLERFDMKPRFSDARPRSRQIGGVARAECPCVVHYRARP
ncbi:MAG TPA: cytochrome P450 [Acidimicrobiales bacterium]|nr:cytochrome P450 [Acidimicrobiales bacterium]